VQSLPTDTGGAASSPQTQPMLVVSGNGLGGITHKAVLENFHLQLQYRWGEKRYRPRENAPRDSGLLYHASGAPDPKTGWLESVEFGMLEGGETGDFWSVPGTQGQRILVDAEGEEIPKPLRRYSNQILRWKKGGPMKSRQTTAPVAIASDPELPRGKWNTLDLYCVGADAIHIVNGTPVLVLTNIAAASVPLTKGQIQLQSEGAETHFRFVRVRPIREFPPALAGLVSRP
jgi:hypothetical protein